jgi:hypothetical protein
MLLTITVVLVVMCALAVLEVWMFWQLGERADRHGVQARRGSACSEHRTGCLCTGPIRRVH